MCPKYTDRRANIGDPDQSAPEGSVCIDWGAVWSGCPLFAQNCLSHEQSDQGLHCLHISVCPRSSLIRVFTVCPDLSVPGAVWSGSSLSAQICLSQEQSDQGLHCLPRSVCPMSSLIRVFTVCPDLSVPRAVWSGPLLFAQFCLSQEQSDQGLAQICLSQKQSDQGLHCLPRSVCPRSSLIRVFTVCPDLSVPWAVWSGSSLFAQICLSQEQSDQGLYCLPSSVCPRSSLIRVWLKSVCPRSSLIRVYTVCPDLSVPGAVWSESSLFAQICLSQEQSDQGLHCLSRSVCPKT